MPVAAQTVRDPHNELPRQRIGTKPPRLDEQFPTRTTKWQKKEEEPEPVISTRASSQDESEEGDADPEPFTIIDWICWYIVRWGFLLRFQKGFCRIIFPDGKSEGFGDPKSDLQAEIAVRRPRVFRRFLLTESIGLAESYMDGDWNTKDLTTFVNLVLEQDKAGVLVGLPFLKEIEIKIRQLYNYIFRAGYHFDFSLANVDAHYNLGNDLYERMLDPTTFSYTCALYRPPDAGYQHFISEGQFDKKNAFQAYKQISLDQAQLNKIHLVIRKAGIQKHHRVVELGCGFGGFSLELAKSVGCRVDCYNLSVEQLALARAKAEASGVGHLINYMHDDYRACVHYYPESEGIIDGVRSELRDRRKTGSAKNMWRKYDAVVSIGMLEHVGHNDLPVFFQTAEKMLKPGGTAVVHTITSNDFGYENHKVTYGFIQKYIFPGACIPAVGAIVDAATQNTKMELQHFENIGQHYAPTLRHWRENFYRNLDEIMSLKDSAGRQKYGTKFVRMWDFYLCNCEAEFICGHFGLGHFVFKRPSSEFTVKEDRDKIMPTLDSLHALKD
ncbi:unnamed protein product [Amoebophrya sp. A25]|nr:unnamed protein product [Amoebophrya sp. A25]|eukprot:GSA25T00004987001.1